MPDPSIKDIKRRWAVGRWDYFHVFGASIAPNATVNLQDDRADWDPATVTDPGDGTYLIFRSKPNKKKHGAGTLTVTITNPNDGTSNPCEVAGTYE